MVKAQSSEINSGMILAPPEKLNLSSLAYSQVRGIPTRKNIIVGKPIIKPRETYTTGYCRPVFSCVRFAQILKI